jgi:hypothetical protein
MIVTADGQQHTFSSSPASMIAVNIVGTWLAPTRLTRVTVTSPGP